mmetsp:Transcript_12320/g.33380  ORF Transcript_12320/g.33380 Transcript_12320/m.33380 type:complete len:375 (+) Transcript_12320:571-1695(+)
MPRPIFIDAVLLGECFLARPGRFFLHLGTFQLLDGYALSRRRLANSLGGRAGPPFSCLGIYIGLAEIRHALASLLSKRLVFCFRLRSVRPPSSLRLLLLLFESGKPSYELGHLLVVWLSGCGLLRLDISDEVGRGFFFCHRCLLCCCALCPLIFSVCAVCHVGFLSVDLGLPLVLLRLLRLASLVDHRLDGRGSEAALLEAGNEFVVPWALVLQGLEDVHACFRRVVVLVVAQVTDRRAQHLRFAGFLRGGRALVRIVIAERALHRGVLLVVCSMKRVVPGEVEFQDIALDVFVSCAVVRLYQRRILDAVALVLIRPRVGAHPPCPPPLLRLRTLAELRAIQSLRRSGGGRCHRRLHRRWTRGRLGRRQGESEV